MAKKKANGGGRAITPDSLVIEEAPRLVLGGEPVPPAVTVDDGGDADDGPPRGADEILADNISGVQSAAQQARKDSRERLRQLDDTEFWFAVVFETREQKEVFLKAMGWLRHADKYLDGHALAALEDVILPPSDLKPLPPKPDRKLTALAHPVTKTGHTKSG